MVADGKLAIHFNDAGIITNSGKFIGPMLEFIAGLGTLHWWHALAIIASVANILHGQSLANQSC